MKLKTLKDFEWRAIWEYEEGGKGYAICLPDLKQEAIKRVKHYESELKFREGQEVRFAIMTGKIMAIKELFNITESDLK